MLQSGVVVVALVHVPGEIEMELPPVFWGSENTTCVLPALSKPVLPTVNVNWKANPSLVLAAVANEAGTIANLPSRRITGPGDNVTVLFPVGESVVLPVVVIATVLPRLTDA